jgi:Family of unknown function (DUF5317)
MFILYAVVIGLAIGLVSGGRIASIGDIRLRWAPLILIGFGAQVLLFSDAVAARVGDLGPELYVGSTLLVVIAVVRNLAIPGLPLVAVGAACNFSAIVANGGFMPASPAAMAALGKSAPTIYSNSAVVAQPALAPLTDIFALPTWLPWHNIFSIGDVILAVGVAMAIAVAMRRGMSVATTVRPGGAWEH